MYERSAEVVLTESTPVKRREKRQQIEARKTRGYGINRNPLLLLARSERFELPTDGFEVRCSIQLSYERKKMFESRNR
jgi:hypothetical protein